MTTQELRKLNIKELESELIALKREQFNLRLKQKVGEANTAYLFPRVRRKIARIKTLITEKSRV